MTANPVLITSGIIEFSSTQQNIRMTTRVLGHSSTVHIVNGLNILQCKFCLQMILLLLYGSVIKTVVKGF